MTKTYIHRNQIRSSRKTIWKQDHVAKRK